LGRTYSVSQLMGVWIAADARPGKHTVLRKVAGDNGLFALARR
jgi:hypothetical protein